MIEVQNSFRTHCRQSTDNELLQILSECKEDTQATVCEIAQEIAIERGFYTDETPSQGQAVIDILRGVNGGQRIR